MPQVHTKVVRAEGPGTWLLGRVGGGVGEADTGDPDRRRREAALCPVCCESPVCV